MTDPAEIARQARGAAEEVRRLGARAMANPISAVLTALVAGFVIGLVLRLFEKGPRVRREEPSDS
jgi:hypothetical protein